MPGETAVGPRGANPYRDAIPAGGEKARRSADRPREIARRDVDSMGEQLASAVGSVQPRPREQHLCVLPQVADRRDERDLRSGWREGQSPVDGKTVRPDVTRDGNVQQRVVTDERIDRGWPRGVGGRVRGRR